MIHHHHATEKKKMEKKVKLKPKSKANAVGGSDISRENKQRQYVPACALQATSDWKGVFELENAGALVHVARNLAIQKDVFVC